MFRQRKSSQKPGDELLANFRQQFPQVGGTTGAPESSATAAPAHHQVTTTSDNPIIDPSLDDRQQGLDGDVFHDQDPTPRASHEPWRLTPSLLDPNSFSFASFVNAPPGYYTPTPGGTSTLFHPQAGDLHTPTMGGGPGLGTPLSMPTSGTGLHAGQVMGQIEGFQTLPPHQLHHFNPFVQAPAPHQVYAPSTFVHQDTGYETMEQDGSPSGSGSDGRMKSIDSAFQSVTPLMNFQPRQMTNMHPHALSTATDKFRFHAALNAPTAMIKQADEIPITYLNKGQAYSLSIMDVKAGGPVAPGTRYRTFVRVSFEDDEQRQKPGVCWGLWKEGRGTNEAHHRGGKLQAVEYVESGQGSEQDDRKPRVELEMSSFDGFSVTWTPGSNTTPEVNIAVRFNFLSTDFSHSKGVKGIPVRLCAKTHPVSPTGSTTGTDSQAETCYCKVKLFRDHGAERKLSNDIAHVKKSIDKVKQSIAQAESGSKDFGKRKRGSVAPKMNPKKPGKTPKHKRTWSMSSVSSAGGGNQLTVEEDLHIKLQTLQDMFTSTRPISILYLKGDELDDPDLHPVSMPGEMSPPSQHVGIREGVNWQGNSSRDSATGSLVSPSPSQLSLASHPSNTAKAGQWQQDSKTMDPNPSKVHKTDDAGNASGFIEATGVDKSYRPPKEQKPKAVACIYVVRHDPQQPNTKHYHRAVYLMSRTLEDLNQRLRTKFGIATNILRTIHTTQTGVEVEVDDDFVSEMKEGQDMAIEVEELSPPVKREWEMNIDEPGDSDRSATPANGVMIRLVF